MKRIFAPLFLLVASVAHAQTTPYMSIDKPVPSSTIGPAWAQKLNDGIDVIDAHDHSPGKGVRVSPSGLNINADLPFGGNQATGLKSVAFSSQVSAPSGNSRVYDKGGNFYFKNGSGVEVQITSGSGVNTSVSGAFSASAPGAYPYTVVSGDAQRVLLVDTSATRTINLPAATTAMLFGVKDTTGSAATNAISVVPNGTDTIDGVNATRKLQENKGWWFFISDGVNNWSIATMRDTAVPAGAMQLYGGAVAPAGWLLCDGSAVSRTTYAALFAAIGTNFGSGDGSTTFNLPDLRQRFPIGKAASGTGSTLGGTGGAIDHTHSVPAHYHGMGTGADLNITSSGSHVHSIDHDHANGTTGSTGLTTNSSGAHQHFVANSDLASGSDDFSASETLSRSLDAGANVYNYDLKTTNTGANRGLSSSDGAHTHTVDPHTHTYDTPAFAGNSGSATHTHASNSFAGSIGLVTGGVDGNASMTSGTSNPPFLAVNYIIKW